LCRIEYASNTSATFPFILLADKICGSSRPECAATNFLTAIANPDINQAPGTLYEANGYDRDKISRSFSRLSKATSALCRLAGAYNFVKFRVAKSIFSGLEGAPIAQGKQGPDCPRPTWSKPDSWLAMAFRFGGGGYLDVRRDPRQPPASPAVALEFA
jgi:hypothetical protein